MVHPPLELPPALQRRIDDALRSTGANLNEHRRLADAVLRLSDFYIEQPGAPTPWSQPWARQAYLCYFLPLNFLRMQSVIQRGLQVGFWRDLNQLVDFGSGPGTVPLALAAVLPGQFISVTAVERAKAAAELYNRCRGDRDPHPRWVTDLPEAGTPQGRLVTFSFALTELEDLPRGALSGEALAVIEPATRDDGRRLLALRARLIGQGWHPWAPCTHAAPCPLREKSQRDWCHDRMSWDQPPWFTEMAKHLPMENRTLTHSYLLLRRTQPPWSLVPDQRARLTGDLMRGKGSSRQLVCRGADREFLSWQHRFGEPPKFPRGDLVSMPADIQIRGSELRPEHGVIKTFSG